MHPNEELLARFYDALNRHDAQAMAACYAPDVRFSDPAFPDLRGDRARGMWAMLCERGKDLAVESSGITADDSTGRAHWDARYTFLKTGKKVHNAIDSAFTFRDGLIEQHTDTFDFKRWASQALGLTGTVLGGTSMLRKKVQATAAKTLDDFLSAQPGRV